MLPEYKTCKTIELPQLISSMEVCVVADTGAVENTGVGAGTGSQSY
jgi:hypothetical protein